MLRQHGNAESCSDAEILRSAFQGKWRLLVLREILTGPMRLSELHRRIPDCSKKVLIDTLHGLEDMAWVERQEYNTKVRKVEYQLNATCAEQVARVVRAIHTWVT